MARIAGVDLPPNKQIKIGLTYVYGIGRTRAKDILGKAEVAEDVKVKDLTEDDARKIRQVVHSLLPLADGSVPAVTLSEVASEFWQLGDRQQLFKEVFRVLRPGGCILLAERLRTPINLLVNGPAGLRLSPIAYWENLLLEAGFKIEKNVSLNDLICCLRADKPAPIIEGQLPLDF